MRHDTLADIGQQRAQAGELYDEFSACSCHERWPV